MSINLDDRRSQKGFTLIELIVVLVILSLLAAVVAPNVFKYLARGKNEAAKMQVGYFEEALTLFLTDMGRFPTTAEGLDALVRNPGNLDAWNGPYLKKGLPNDPWGKPYVYRCPGIHGEYDLFSFGPDGAEGGDDDVCSWK